MTIRDCRRTSARAIVTFWKLRTLVVRVHDVTHRSTNKELRRAQDTSKGAPERSTSMKDDANTRLGELHRSGRVNDRPRLEAIVVGKLDCPWVGGTYSCGRCDREFPWLLREAACQRCFPDTERAERLGVKA